MNEEILNAIKQSLSNSDIVWPRYGSETIEELAAKIAKKIELIERSKIDPEW
jgi:hypothetical protein